MKDSPGAAADARRIQPLPFPQPDQLRRIYSWSGADFGRGDNSPARQRIAYHEAGHAVVFEWVGGTCVGAEAAGSTGVAWIDFSAECDTDAEVSPLAACHAAAGYHAGLMAELLYLRHPWSGVVVRESSSDHQIAQRILAPHFGMSSSGHGFAQRVALAVLSRRWERVTDIAECLHAHGRWEPTEPEIPV